MDETVIRLDELTRMFNVLCRFQQEGATADAFVDRAATLLGQEGESDLQRRMVGTLALYGELPESQLAWYLAKRHLVDDIRSSIDQLLRVGRIERRGMSSLRLPSTK